uniref:HicA toxin of toxin-antitoxin n=1 Tax=Candidatus Kentrum sp. FW TaxID=2126338 RepID=A0A450THE3_9GAMM|nr:MAG: HicA toxin of toxin-antitoxin [Candidatus Kentron sp. FW]
MPKFPVDAPNRQVVKTLRIFGFRLVREGNHIAMERMNADGISTPLTMPNHPTIKGSTSRTILTQASISRDDFLEAYNRTQKGVRNLREMVMEP